MLADAVLGSLRPCCRGRPACSPMAAVCRTAVSTGRAGGPDPMRGGPGGGPEAGPGTRPMRVRAAARSYEGLAGERASRSSDEPLYDSDSAGNAPERTSAAYADTAADTS
jgi:hypothetical protein